MSLLLDPEPDKCWSLLIPVLTCTKKKKNEEINNLQLYFSHFRPFQTKQHCTCRNYFTYLDVLKIRASTGTSRQRAACCTGRGAKISCVFWCSGAITGLDSRVNAPNLIQIFKKRIEWKQTTGEIVIRLFGSACPHGTPTTLFCF